MTDTPRPAPPSTPDLPPETQRQPTPAEHQQSAQRSRQPLPRRALITGAGGLLVGAAATEGAQLISRGRNATPSKRPPAPVEALMTEHGLFTRLLLAYRTAAERLTTDTPLPVAAIADAAQVISDYIHSFHEGLEEAYVFPRVRDTHPELVRTLLIQHDRGRHLTAAITAVRDLDLARPAARAALRGQLEAFARMYEPHEAREDTVVYPALRDALSQPQMDLLAERFHDLENQLFGDTAQRQMLDRVAGVEQQLGIADLAVFTAPAPS